MSKLDDAINDVLADEDAKLMDMLNTEPSYVNQAFGLFKGRLGWVMMVAFGFSFIAFAFCLYCLFALTSATDALSATKWGVGVIAGLQINVFLRGFMGSHLEGNRLMREIKRLELRIVRGRDSI